MLWKVKFFPFEFLEGEGFEGLVSSLHPPQNDVEHTLMAAGESQGSATGRMGKTVESLHSAYTGKSGGGGTKGTANKNSRPPTQGKHYEDTDNEQRRTGGLEGMDD